MIRISYGCNFMLLSYVVSYIIKWHNVVSNQNLYKRDNKWVNIPVLFWSIRYSHTKMLMHAVGICRPGRKTWMAKHKLISGDLLNT